MLGDLTEGQIESVLYNLMIGRIGCHANDITYVVPITYAYNGEYVYGHTQEGMKVDMMRENPKVCFQVDSIENMGNWRSVIAWGTFEELKAAKDREVGLRLLQDRTMPFITGETTIQQALKDAYGNRVEVLKGVVFRIKLTTKTGRFEK